MQPLSLPVNTTLFELFKTGPGPSSSHTIGPMRMGLDFLQLAKETPADTLKRAQKAEVRLFGSLSATGEGHGTHRAVLAGLLGQAPDTCPPDFLDTLFQPEGQRPDMSMDLGAVSLPLSMDTVLFDAVQHDRPHPNTLVIRLLGADGPVLEREYYSVGGGFISWKGRKEPERGKPAHPFSTALEAEQLAVDKKLPVGRLVLDNEMSITGASQDEVFAGLDRVMEVMDQAVERGLAAQGALPGPIGLHRKAWELHQRYHSAREGEGRLLLALNAYAFAAAEENAAGHTIVTAPTAGSAGVLPAVLRVLRQHVGVAHDALRRGMLAAAFVGYLCKHNASISGAEVGCQGEVGVASSMAAALMAHAFGYDFAVVRNAAEIALEHHLGLTCDPVRGYVQIPCIERNAMGAVKAYNAFLIASSQLPASNVVGLDKAIAAMAETGRDMSPLYKETAGGGLATAFTP